MTLEELRSVKHEDLFFAVVSRVLSWEEAKGVYIYLPEYPNGITAEEALNISIQEALAEDKKPVTKESIKRLEEKIKKKITSNLVETFKTIVWLKDKECHIDLTDMTDIEAAKYEISLYPIREYYKEDAYSFEEDEEGKPYLQIDLEPFEKFVKDYKKGKFN